MCLIGTCYIAGAQTQPIETPFAVPVDSITNLITYEGVIEVKGHDAATLYNRIVDWLYSYYKNPRDVIRQNDSVTHVAVGKPRVAIFSPPDKDGSKSPAGHIQYTLTIAARDGRFKYELTEFNWKQTSYYPCERWLDTQASSYVPAYNDYLQQLDKISYELINSLKEAVTKEKPVKNKNNW